MVFCLFAKNPAASKSGVTLLTCVALATLGAVIQVRPVFSTWSLGGGCGQGAIAEVGVTHATLAGLKWVLFEALTKVLNSQYLPEGVCESVRTGKGSLHLDLTRRQ